MSRQPDTSKCEPMTNEVRRLGYIQYSRTTPHHPPRESPSESVTLKVAGEDGGETLLRDVWGYEPTLDTRTVDTTVQRLRAKLEQAADHLETVRGVGYRLIDLNG